MLCPIRRAVAAAVALLLVAGACRDGSAPGGERASAPSTAATDAAGREADVRRAASVVTGPVPTVYEVVRRVVDGPGRTAVVATERVTVRRPFDGRVEVLDGEPPGGAPVSLRTSRVGELVTGGPAQQAVRLPIAPEPAVGDLRVDAVLSSAVAAGSARLGGERRIAGRSCTVVEVGGEPFASGLGPVGRGGDGGELCVDGSGIVLAETYRLDGDVVRRTEVVEVRVGDEVDAGDARFTTAASTIPVAAGGGDVRPVDPGEDVPGPQWRIQTPPDGFEPIGRTSVVSAQSGIAGTNPSSGRRVSLTETWVRGPDMLVLEQGAGTDAGSALGSSPEGRAVAVGSLGRGQLVHGLRRSEVRVLTDDGFVRVYGTLPPDELLAVARTAVQDPS